MRLARGDALPEYASDGSPYAAPFQGMFYTTHPDRASLFRKETIPGIAWAQSLYAQTANDDVAAVAWRERAKEEVDALPRCGAGL
jgi:hypothetical protein